MTTHASAQGLGEPAVAERVEEHIERQQNRDDVASVRRWVRWGRRKDHSWRRGANFASTFSWVVIVPLSMPSIAPCHAAKTALP